MLRYQTNLPKLPVPVLSETLQKYLKSVHPIVSAEEYKRTEQAVKDFEAPGGLGQQLQQRLVARAQDPSVVNWMEEWWNDQAYMGYRDPVVVYVSYFFAYKDDKFRKIPAERAAAITTAALEFKKAVVEKTLEPEFAKGEPLCMDSYKYMFNNCRIANKPSDLAVIYDPFKNTHIIVIRKNKFYIVDTVHHGVQLSTKELQHQFEKIIDQAGDIKGIPVGVLTSDNRDKWVDVSIYIHVYNYHFNSLYYYYQNRELLLAANPRNKQILEKIETSSFVVCLDDLAPTTRDELCRASWHGDGRNRYFDKPLQFIVYENGRAGFMGEVM